MEDLDQELRAVREENSCRVLPRHPETEFSSSSPALSQGVRQWVRRRVAAQHTASRVLKRLEGMLEGRLDSARSGAGLQLLGGPFPPSLADRILRDVTEDVFRLAELQREGLA